MRYQASAFLALWILAASGCAGASAETEAVAETCSGAPSVKEPVAGWYPQYPMRAAQRGIEGWVDLEVTLGPDGSVERVEICDLSDDVFSKPALIAVRKWRYDALAESESSQSTLRIRFEEGPLSGQGGHFQSPQELMVTTGGWSASRFFGEPIPYEPLLCEPIESADPNNEDEARPGLFFVPDSIDRGYRCPGSPEVRARSE